VLDLEYLCEGMNELMHEIEACYLRQNAWVC